MQFIVNQPGYLNDKLWQEGEVIESEKPLVPSTWYHAKGENPLPEANINASHALMNKDKQPVVGSPQANQQLADAKRELAEKDRELDLKDKEIERLKAAVKR